MMSLIRHQNSGPLLPSSFRQFGDVWLATFKAPGFVSGACNRECFKVAKTVVDQALDLALEPMLAVIQAEADFHPDGF